MPNSIRLKKSGVAGKVPQVTDLSISELSYNYVDGVLYGKRTSGGLENIVEFAGSENHHLLKHLATPGVPASGYMRFYAKSDDNLYLFTSAGVERKLWHSGNHGSGSGLDADTLDGEHASSFALAYHTHSNHVLKAGDTMTGNLSIVKTSVSPTAEAYYRVAAQDSSSDALQVYSKVNSQQGSGQYTLYAIATHSSVPSQCNIFYFDANSARGLALHIGDDSLPNISIKASTGSLGNATHVYVQDTDGWLKRVPVSSFGGGGSGTVNSVGLSMPNIFSVSGSPVTTSGTLEATLASQSQRLFLASPVSGSGVPTFRAIQGNDLPDLSASYDFYGSWNMKVNTATTKMILKSGSAQYSTMFNGINLIAGENITLTESSISGALGITIAASSGGGGLSYAGVALNQSPAPISANTWTDIPVAQYATWGTGSYLIMGTIQMVKSTTGAGLVAARIIMSNGTVIASAEHYHYTTTTNRMSFTLSGIYPMGGGAALTAKLQIWSNQTGWSAVANTPTSNVVNATKIEVIKIS